MQNNKIIQIAVLGLMLLGAMWAVSFLLEATAQTRNVFLGVGFFVVLLVTLWRKIPLDAKLLFIVILGYALGGKGFAYVSPVEPVYIGEISLALCMLGLMTRLGHSGLFDTSIHKLIWVYLIYAGIHLIIDYDQYRLLAIRDSSTAYYALFFFASYSLFLNDQIVHAFARIIKIALVFSALQILMGKFSVRFPGFLPQVDAYIPLSAAAAFYFCVMAIENRKISYIVISGILTLLCIMGKTSHLLSLVAVMASAVLFGRMRTLMGPIAIMSVIAVVVGGVLLIVNPAIVIDFIAESDTMETLSLDSGAFIGSTTKWRWDWWMTIWHDTMRTAPFWGAGFGGDISTAFLGPELGKQVRYPHSIMFTAIGRLGLIGLSIFLTLFITIAVFTIKFCRSYYNRTDRCDADLICSGIVVAGMLNALLQATYEVPHAAILHWVCLGYMASRYYGPQTYRNMSAQKPEL